MAIKNFWKLDETTGTVATDYGPSPANGTYNRDASNTAAASGPGTAITKSQLFSRGTDAVDITSAAFSRTSGQAWSVSLWCKPASFGGQYFGEVSGANYYVYQVNTTNIDVRVGGNLTHFAIVNIGLHAWQHLLVTRSAANVRRLFQNGVESSSGSATDADTFAPKAIGRAGGASMDGNVCWVKLFDTDESANVAALYAERDASGLPAGVLAAILGDD